MSSTTTILPSERVGTCKCHARNGLSAGYEFRIGNHNHQFLPILSRCDQINIQGIPKRCAHGCAAPLCESSACCQKHLSNQTKITRTKYQISAENLSVIVCHWCCIFVLFFVHLAAVTLFFFLLCLYSFVYHKHTLLQSILLVAAENLYKLRAPAHIFTLSYNTSNKMSVSQQRKRKAAEESNTKQTPNQRINGTYEKANGTRRTKKMYEHILRKTNQHKTIVNNNSLTYETVWNVHAWLLCMSFYAVRCVRALHR